MKHKKYTICNQRKNGFTIEKTIVDQLDNPIDLSVYILFIYVSDNYYHCHSERDFITSKQISKKLNISEEEANKSCDYLKSLNII